MWKDEDEDVRAQLLLSISGSVVEPPEYSCDIFMTFQFSCNTPGCSPITRPWCLCSLKMKGMFLVQNERGHQCWVSVWGTGVGRVLCSEERDHRETENWFVVALSWECSVPSLYSCMFAFSTVVNVWLTENSPYSTAICANVCKFIPTCQSSNIYNHVVKWNYTPEQQLWSLAHIGGE